jgi:acetyltransferase-like isoleucine patch superfamily enzyme
MAILTVTQPLLDLLRERTIFHSYAGADRWTPQQTALVVADDCEIEPYTHIFQGNVIPRALGAFSYSNSPLHAAMSIGRYTSIAWQVSVMGDSHPMEWATTSSIFYQPTSGAYANPGYRLYRRRNAMNVRSYEMEDEAVTIGHDVWIGEQVLLKRGITIGSGAVIGARSLVLEDVPPYAIVVGQPARVIRSRFSPELVERFLALEWWRFHPDMLSRFPLDQPAAFLDELEAAVAAGTLPVMRPAALRLPELAAAADLGQPAPPA